MNELQEKLLDIMAWFHNFCVKENLRYYVIGGTFLGAIRHKGFIPWDDDIDVGMPRRDYEKLITVFQNENNHKIDKFKLETPYSNASDYLYTFSKLYDTTTTMVEKLRIECKRGIYLDIFPLDGIGDTKEEAYKNFKKIDFLNMFLMTRVCAIRKSRSFYKNAAIVVSRIIPNFIIDNKKLSQKVDQLCKKLDFDTSNYVCNCMSPYRSTEIIEKRLLGKPTEYQFESITVYGPEYYDEYLKHIFGDYRKFPPKEKQVSHHDFVMFDLNKSYLE